MVILLLANGFEELEAITPVDVLRRNNIDIRTVSITNEKLITGTHGIQIAADLIASDVPLTDIDLLILPGGMPGVKNLDASPITKIFIDATLRNNGRLAAICAAPSIFGKHGMLTNIKATCFPGFEKDMLNAILTDKSVVTDGIFSTARDYLSATAFANELVKVCDSMGIKPHDENEEPAKAEDETEEIDLEELFKSFEFSFGDDDESEEDEITVEDFGMPSLSISDDGSLTSEDVDEIERTAKTLISTLASFNVSAEVKLVERGPRITRYSVVPAKGVKVNSVTRLYDDIVLNLAKDGVRMQAPIPGKSAIGFEIPNDKPQLVELDDLIKSEEFKSQKSSTLVALGKDVSGKAVFADVSKFPHAIITGATGMGKSMCINSILISLIYNSSPDELRLVLIDPKKVEFCAYDNLPHLLTPIITEAKAAAGALTWAVEEMERRYGLLESQKVRNLEAYNEKVKQDPSIGNVVPRIVIVIDELADLMMQVRNPIEDLIMRIAQKARAAGIHLIIGTQRPATNVLTGVIKANIPTRISCKLTTQVDSRAVLEMSGAEKLLSRGDMLYLSASSAMPERIQGAYISDNDVKDIAKAAEFLHSKPVSDLGIGATITDFIVKLAPVYDEYDEEEEDANSYYNDEVFLNAVEVAIESKKVSTSLLQRKLSIGYGKAAKYIDAMEEMGIISEPNAQKPRDVLMTLDEWHEKLARIK